MMKKLLLQLILCLILPVHSEAQARPIVHTRAFYQTWKRDYDREARQKTYDWYANRQWHRRATHTTWPQYSYRSEQYLKGIKLQPVMDMWGRRKVPAPRWLHARNRYTVR